METAPVPSFYHSDTIFLCIFRAISLANMVLLAPTAFQIKSEQDVKHQARIHFKDIAPLACLSLTCANAF